MVDVLLKATAAVLAAAFLGLAQAADEPPSAWPEQVVPIEAMHPLTVFILRTRGLVVKGSVQGPAILRVHVDAEGAVVRAVGVPGRADPHSEEPGQGAVSYHGA